MLFVVATAGIRIDKAAGCAVLIATTRGCEKTQDCNVACQSPQRAEPPVDSVSTACLAELILDVNARDRAWQVDINSAVRRGDSARARRRHIDVPTALTGRSSRSSAPSFMPARRAPCGRPAVLTCA